MAVTVARSGLLEICWVMPVIGSSKPAATAFADGVFPTVVHRQSFIA